MQKLVQIIKQNKRVAFVGGFFIILILLFEIEPNIEIPIVENDSYSEYDLSAESILVIDQTTGEIVYNRNTDQVHEIASITKVMTALVAMEELYDSTIRVSRSAFESFGDTGLLINEKWETKDIVSFMLVNSSNDAAEAISRNYETGRERFIERMNDRARELGLALIFLNPTGLNETEEFGGKGSAEDVAKLFSYTYDKYPDIFSGTSEKSFSISSFDTYHTATNTNLFANALLGLQAGKTGYTDKSGGSLVARFNVGLNNPYLAVVLGTEGRESRFLDMQKLIKAVSEESVDY